MAKKRRKTTRRKSSPSGGGHTRRRKSGTRRRGLSAGGMKLSTTTLMNAAKETGLAMTGGGLGIMAHKLIPAATGKWGRLGIILGLGIAGHVIGFPKLTNGMVGSMTGQSFPNGLSDDDASFADEDVLSDMPLFLDDDGSPMVLEEGDDGAQYRYLSDEEVEMMERAGAFDAYQDVS